MGFRNPVYLDLPLLKNMADYYGVDVPVTAQVVRRIVGERGSGAGGNGVVQSHLQPGGTEELTETFATEIRPVRLMNDVIDHLLQEKQLTDLAQNPSEELVAQVPVQITGELTLSPVTEIASLMARFMPLLIAQASQGATEFNLDRNTVMQIFMSAPAEDHPQLFSLEAPDDERSFIVIIDLGGTVGDITSDDLEGEFTIFGNIERLLSPTSSMSLDRYLLPGTNRAMRRAMSKNSIQDLVRLFAELPGHNVDVSSLTIHGPGAIIRPVAIY